MNDRVLLMGVPSLCIVLFRLFEKPKFLPVQSNLFKEWEYTMSYNRISNEHKEDSNLTEIIKSYYLFITVIR